MSKNSDYQNARNTYYTDPELFELMQAIANHSALSLVSREQLFSCLRAKEEAKHGDLKANRRDAARAMLRILDTISASL